jgi:hypothetical protein
VTAARARAKHWLHVLTELRNRGVVDVCMLTVLLALAFASGTAAASAALPGDGPVATRPHRPPSAARDDPPLPRGQYTSIRFTETLALEGISASIGSVGDYDNAAAETVIGLYKNEAIRPDSPFRIGPLRTVADVEKITSTTSTGTTTTACTAPSTTAPPRSTSRPTTLYTRPTTR